MAKTPKPSKLNVSISTPESAKAAGLTEENILWAPQAGPQSKVMVRPEFEIFFGGAKFGGKSFCIIGWLLKGNPDIPSDRATPLDLTYINCPHYRALVVRRNLEDLNSWIGEADRIYSKLGANYTQKPNEFTFPSGAKVVMGHLDDDRAVEKYFGNVVHRAAIDELTFIADRKNYMKLYSCVRSNIKGIRAQMLLTGNPGGPGSAWVMDRFVEPKDADGEIIPPETTITETSWNPFLKKNVGQTRIFIPSKIGDNPKGLETDPTYYNRLATMDEAERNAYLFGDWHSLGGLFFTDFRPKHRDGEPPEACHVIQTGSRPLLPWLPRFAACDWGFGHSAVVYGAVKDLNGQTIIHRELVLNGAGSVELGDAIARMFLPDLEGLHREGARALITLWLSPDAFAKRDIVKTQAEGIAEGIARVLGKDAVHLPGIFAPSAAAGEGELFRERAVQEKSGIAIMHAQNARRAGAAHLREMLRWRQVASVPEDQFNQEIYYNLLHESSDKARTYLDAHKKRKAEVLPKMLVESHCTRLIASIPTLVADAKDIEDVLKTGVLSDDVYDAWRYLLFSEDAADNREPKKSFVGRRVMEVREREPDIDYNGLVWANRFAEAEYANQNQSMKPIDFAPESSRRYRGRRVN